MSLGAHCCVLRRAGAGQWPEVAALLGLPGDEPRTASWCSTAVQ